MYIWIISYLKNVVNFKDDGGFTTIFDKFKTVIPKIDEGTTSILKKISKIQVSQLPNVNWDKWCKKNKVADDSLKSFLKTWDGTGDVSEQYQQHLAKVTSSTAKFTAALKSMAVNIAISVAINVLISAVSNLIKAGDEIRKQAQELGETFNNTKSDIADYKEEVESLYEVINDNSSSIAEVTDARKQLLTVQDEMIDKYGTEQSSIDAITRAIKGETSAWEDLAKAKWQEALNQYKDNDGEGMFGWWEGFWKNLNNRFHGYANNIERMQNEYGNYEATIEFGVISNFHKSKY